MPSSSPAAAAEIINSYDRRNSGNGREDDRLRSNVLALCKDYLAVYRADDATALTQAWLNSVGGTNANPSIFTIGAGLTLSINTSGATAILATTPASTALPTTATRGAVRRLVAPLGIVLTEAALPA